MTSDAQGSPIREIYQHALSVKDDGHRQAYLDEACGVDTPVRTRVEKLLTARNREKQHLLQRAVAVNESVSQMSAFELGPSELGETSDLRLHELENLPVDAHPMDGPTDISQHPTIGNYKLLQQIGEGGFGTVYMAKQTSPVRRKVALKIIKAGMDSKEVLARFEAEKQALALMDHPNIAKVLDAGTTSTGRPYFVMELVHGTQITDYCDDNRLTTDQRLSLFVDVCRAVQHAHMKGIIHRDLKPSNVLVTMSDGQPMVKVIDFGVSKALHQDLTDATVFTAYGQLVGTPMYMSPEQAQFSAHDIDVRSDVYSLGVILYELLTGQTPFDREQLRASGFDEMCRILREVDPPRPSDRVSTLRAEQVSTVSDTQQRSQHQIARSLVGELDWIVMKALSKERDRRYQSAQEFATDVQRYLEGETVQACPPSLGYRFKKSVRRHRVGLAIAGMLVVSLLAGSSVALVYAFESARSRDNEAIAREKAEEAALQEHAQAVRAEQNLQMAIRALKDFHVKMATGPLAKNAEWIKARTNMIAQSLKILRSIDDSNPSNAQLQIELARTYHDLGIAYLDSGEFNEAQNALAEAVDACRRALAIADKSGIYELQFSAYDDEPGVTAGRDRYEILLATVLGDLANAWDGIGDKRACIETDRQSLQITRKLVKQYPGKFIYRRLHVVGLGNLNLSLDPKQDVEEIYRNYAEAISLGKELVEQYPQQTLEQESLALQYMNFAEFVWNDTKDVTDAEAYRVKAIAMFERLRKQDTNDFDIPNYLATCYQARAEMYHDLEQDESAIEPARKSLAIRMQLEADGQTYPELQFRLAKQAFWLATYLGNDPANERRTEQIQSLGVAIDRLRKLIADAPENTSYRLYFSDSASTLAAIYSAAGQYEKRIEILDELVSVCPNDALALNNLAYYLVANKEPSVRDAQKALRLARRAVELRPNDPELLDTLSEVAYRAGEWNESKEAREKKGKFRLPTLNDQIFLCMSHWQVGNKEQAREILLAVEKQFMQIESPAPSVEELYREATELVAEVRAETPRS